MSALPVNLHRSMEAFASARWSQTAESAEETRDPKSYPCCALAFLISRELQGALIQGDTRNPCSLFAELTAGGPNSIMPVPNLNC
jgi:hypothetical protein